MEKALGSKVGLTTSSCISLYERTFNFLQREMKKVVLVTKTVGKIERGGYRIETTSGENTVLSTRYGSDWFN